MYGIDGPLTTCLAPLAEPGESDQSRPKRSLRIATCRTAAGPIRTASQEARNTIRIRQSKVTKFFHMACSGLFLSPEYVRSSKMTARIGSTRRLDQAGSGETRCKAMQGHTWPHRRST